MGVEKIKFKLVRVSINKVAFLQEREKRAKKIRMGETQVLPDRDTIHSLCNDLSNVTVFSNTSVRSK